MNIEFYFDPSCPYCWITSRWLMTVKNNRKDINITWRPFSLAIKNNELGSKKGDHIPSHRVLRVILAASQKDADMGNLYTAFGTQNHIMGEAYNDEVIMKVLNELNLPENLLESADDTTLDQELEQSMNSALEVVGDDVGVPIIIFNQNNQRFGYFGPVLMSLPSVSDSLKLWDGLVVMATSKEFYELKRTRNHDDIDTASTANSVKST